MTDLALWVEAVLIGAAFFAGIIDAIAGGGGLITLPAFLLAGIPPSNALATNKLQSLFGSGSATLHYARRGLVDLRTQWQAAVLCFLTAALGAWLVVYIPDDWLAAFLPILLIVIALYFGFKRGLSDTDRTGRMTPFMYGLTIAPIIGLYDGFFGPGAGSFYMLGFVALAGFGLTRATAHTKLLNFASNVGGFTAFAFGGLILWKLGFMMGIAQFLGARLGAALAIKGGAKLIRPLIVITCIGLSIRLLM